MVKEFLMAVNDKLVVEIIKPKNQQTESGLFVPSDNVPQGYGKVLSIGDGICQELKNCLNLNDIIMFAKHAGQDIILENKIYKILFDKEVYGIMKEVE